MSSPGALFRPYTKLVRIEITTPDGTVDTARDAYTVLLDPPREELHPRIDARVREMFSGGLLDEARALVVRLGDAVPPKLPIAYAEAIAVVKGALDVEEAIRRVQVAHRRYARRQVVWLRKERGVEWIAPPIDVEALARRVETR